MPDGVSFFDDNDLAPPSDSEKKILALTLRQAQTAQPVIARETGLAQQSVSRLVKGLIERGCLLEAERNSGGRRGQPSMTVTIAPDFAYSVGVSMMTDALSIALMDFSGAVLAQEHHLMAEMSRAAVIQQLKSSIKTMCASRRLKRKRILGMGVGISGYCMDGKARYNTPRLLDEWALVDIDRLISEEVGLPVLVENDGNAAAIGESLTGHGRIYDSFVYVYIAAGIGGGVVHNRELVRGANGNAGELGLILPADRPLPTMEALRQCLSRAGVSFDRLSDMLAQFDPDWPGVDGWIAESREALSTIASAIAAVVDPKAIVFGGRVPAALAEKIIPAIEIYDYARRAEQRPMPRLLASGVGGDAAAIGAAMLPYREHFFPRTNAV